MSHEQSPQAPKTLAQFQEEYNVLSQRLDRGSDPFKEACRKLSFEITAAIFTEAQKSKSGRETSHGADESSGLAQLGVKVVALQGSPLRFDPRENQKEYSEGQDVPGRPQPSPLLSAAAWEKTLDANNTPSFFKFLMMGEFAQALSHLIDRCLNSLGIETSHDDQAAPPNPGMR